MKGNQSKKIFILGTNCCTRIWLMPLERKTLKVVFHSWLTRVRQLVTFGELSNDVDTTTNRFMCVVASRVAFSYGCPALF
jgi:hypothetical protein